MEVPIWYPPFQVAFNWKSLYWLQLSAVRGAEKRVSVGARASTLILFSSILGLTLTLRRWCLQLSLFQKRVFLKRCNQGSSVLSDHQPLYNTQWGSPTSGLFFGQSANFMHRHSGSRLISRQSSQKGTVIPRPGRPGCKMCQMTTLFANPGCPERRNLVPRNNCRLEALIIRQDRFFE